MRYPPSPPDWRDELQPGDVIRGSGEFRVVREVSYQRPGRLRNITLTIRRRSWTNRCYTVIDRDELRARGFKKAGFRVRLDREHDATILAVIREQDGMRGRSLTARDVEAIA